MTATIRNFWDLFAWQTAHRLTIEIYTLTTAFPTRERFVLSNQMQRAAVSVTSNIAEGFSRLSRKEKRYFYSISLGSITELQSQLLLARDLNYISADKCSQLIEQCTAVQRPITGLFRTAFSAPPDT